MNQTTMNTTTCPHHHKPRADLPPAPPRIAKLPVDERGFYVPYFVQWVDQNNKPAEPGVGRPEFRMTDGRKWTACVKQKLCWVCGEPLGTHLAFVIGPMCAVNRVTSEPPSHRDCAEWSVRGCPFLSRPKMVRREDELTMENKGNTPGIAIERNPGVVVLWMTRSYLPFKVPNGVLLKPGEPISVEWFTEGRPATRAEALKSIDDGLPTLLGVCRDDEERKQCNDQANLVRVRYLPA